MTRINVLLASDHLISRAGLRSLFRDNKEIQIVEECSLDRVAEQASAVGAEVLLLHVIEIGMNSAQLIRDVSRVGGWRVVLVLARAPHEGVLGSLLRAGALGCVLTRSHPAELVRAVQAAARRKRYIDPALNDFVIEALLREESNLSSREHQVLEGLAHGMTQRAISIQLGLSLKTVETYRRRLGEKLNLRSRAEIVDFALSMGILRANQGEERTA